MITEIIAFGSPSRTAITAPGRRGQTYEHLLAAVTSMGRQLRAAGIGREAVVATLLPQGPSSATVFLGVAGAAVAAPLDPSIPEAALVRWLDDVKPELLIVGEGMPGELLETARQSSVRLAVATEDAETAGDVTLELRPDVANHDPLEPTPDDVALILHTSGTTARPKRVPITHRNLTASAEHIVNTLALTADDRCLDVMPLFHIHGLVAGVLASLRAGGTVVCTPPFNGADVFDWLDASEATWMTAVPTMYQGMLDRVAAHRSVISRSSLRLLRSSSSALPGPVHARLEDSFGVPVIEAYGMTEAAHQIASNTADQRVAGSVGRAAGPEVAILDEEGGVVPTGTVGLVAIQGENVIAGYTDPLATDEAFVAGWFLTGDIGSLDADGLLRLTGRSKEMINRGGETIAPAEIDAVLLGHPAVARAMAFAVPDHRLGEQIAALVVAAPAEAIDETTLRRFASTQLAPARVPRRILFVDDVPRGPTGKPRRIGIAEELGLADLDGPPGTNQAPSVAPSGPVETLVHELWSSVIGREGIGVHDRFFDAGGDSLLAMRLLAQMADHLDLEISVVDLFDRPTIAEQAAYVEELLLA